MNYGGHRKKATASNIWRSTRTRTASRWKASWSGSATASGTGLHYKVRCDAKWRTRYAWLKIVGGGELELHGDGAGHWHDGHGLALSAIEGCIDIDIAATPFTNTLPIRCLQLAEGERQPISVAYISTPDLQVTRVEQA